VNFFSLVSVLISPTDPIAMPGIMKSIGAPRRLEVRVPGRVSLQ
jgi:NhaP-type Na+/H+ or K+/H+ antiporter